MPVVRAADGEAIVQVERLVLLLAKLMRGETVDYLRSEIPPLLAGG